MMNMLIDSLELYWGEEAPGYAGGNMAMYFHESQVEHNDFLGPDFFVVLGARPGRRKSWVVWQEGLTPDVVVELLSARTERRDRGDKMQIYARTLHVSNYYLYDPFDARLEGYTLEHGRYTPLQPNASGRLPCPELGLELGPHLQYDTMEGEEVPYLRWFLPDGTLLPSPREHAALVQARADEATARADEAVAQRDTERARAEAAEARLRELESRLRDG